jgi:hypothetical protein
MYVRATTFNITGLCALPTGCLCGFCMILRVTVYYQLNSGNRSVLKVESVFPVKYTLNFCM